MEATTAPIERSAGWNGSRRDRVLAILGALAGALAISGALLTWVTVEKRHQSTAFRGTSFGVGTLALVAGIVMVVMMMVVLVPHLEVRRSDARPDNTRDLDVMVNAQAAQRLSQRLHRQTCVDERGQQHVASSARETVEVNHPCHEAPAARRNEQYTVSVRIR